MIKKENQIVQVVLSRICVAYVKKYIQVFGGSVSGFCKMAVEHYVLNHCKLEDK